MDNELKKDDINLNSPFVELWYGDILTDTCLSKPIEEQKYWDVLNQQEKNKAQTFTRVELQQKYIKTRGVLREILACYLELSAEKVNIKIAEYGKPYLDNNPVYFNLSHTGNKFVVAVSNVSEIGVDLEQYKQRNSLVGLVNKCFSEKEKQHWLALSAEKQTEQFYYLWVRKEAFVKAVGRGIAIGLDQCEINLDNHSQFLSIPDNYGQVDEWKILDVQLEENDFCALVVKNQPFQYKQRMLP